MSDTKPTGANVHEQPSTGELADFSREMEEATDAHLLDLVKNGRVVIDPRTGEEKRDAAGNVVRRPPSAADLDIVLRRLRQIERGRKAAEAGANGKFARAKVNGRRLVSFIPPGATRAAERADGPPGSE